jgi:predicted nuclease of predicted toxin-antitoxin system
VRFLFDHDVPDEAARVLRQSGHEVTLMRSVLPRDATDAEVLRYACEHELILVTCNRNDFLKLAQDRELPGLIILIRRPARAEESAHWLRLIEVADVDGLRGNINFA